MPDPLLQAERQGLLIKRLLSSRTTDLLDKVLGLAQGTFRHMAIDAYAAVSDQGMIRRARKAQAPTARKADAIPGSILERIEAHRKAAHLLNPNPRSFAAAPREFKDKEILRIAHFLRVQSVPAPVTPTDDADARPAAEEPKAPTAPGSAPVEIHQACSSCGSHDLVAKIGRYGPYGACATCGRNTAVRPRCRRCGEQLSVERAPDGFAGTCASCGTTTLVRIGPARSGRR
jgi:hypothetical protein